jgi:hypothetical protein
MQLFVGADVDWFVRIREVNWTGQVKGMDVKRRVSQVFNNNPREVD